MKKVWRLLGALLLLPSVYAEPRVDWTLENLVQQLERSLQYQTSDEGWRVLRNSPEEGFSTGTVSPTGPGLLVSCVPDEFYGAFLVWPGSDSLGTDYDDGDDQPVTLNWRNPNLTQSQQWLHLSPSDEDFDQVLIVNQLNGRPVRPQETDSFLDRLTRHAELNAVVTVSSSGGTKRATFSLDGAPSAETVKACGQERTSSETTLYFPDYVDGAGWSVQLVLSNIGTAAEDATVIVEVFDQGGQPVRDLFDSSGTLKIPSLGNRVLRSGGTGEFRRGWIQVRSDTDSVSGLLTYRHTQTGIEVGVEPVELGNHFALFVEESSEIGTGLAIFKPDSSPRIELRIRDEAGDDPLEGVFASWRNFNQRALTIPEWFEVDGIDTEFLRDFRGLLFLRTEDGSPFAPLGLRFGKRTGSLSAVPVIEVLDGGESGGEAVTRREFESSTPSDYTAVTLSDKGRIWGVPTRYTNDSDPGTVAYMVLGRLKGCDFANAEADRQSTVYIKTQSLGRLDDFESETVCRRTSSRWTSSWPGVRMTHLLFFDESSPTNTREGVYSAATGKIEFGESRPGDAQVAFSEGDSTTREIWENTPPGINVGGPVSAVGADAIAYTIGGTDARSFVIVPETGQIRTRAGITYDYETKSRYSVTVGVEDGEGNSDTIDVTILLRNLVPACGPPSNFRVNHSDERLTLRWSPLSDRVGHARVLGYETEIRRGTSGAWGDRRTFLGRTITGMIYAALTNGIGYQVRVRPINAEADCGWSTPVSGIPTADFAPKDPEGPIDRFGPLPVGTPERNFRFLTRERCRHTSNGQTLDANCEYENTGPDTGRIFLEFDDPSQGSCEITLAFSSLTAGSFIDECFDAGVNTNVPFDRSFRMPRTAPQTGDETDVPRAPRTMEEFDVLAWGRDDLIPGLFFGCPPVFDDCEFTPGFGFRVERDPDTGLPHYIHGEYTYENTGPSQGTLTFRAVDGNDNVFTLDFEPSGQMRVTISDSGGDVPVWPGVPHLDLTLGAQPVLLPIPPSWSAAIAIETDVPGDLQRDLALTLANPFLALAICPQSNPNCTGLNFSRGYLSLGRNRVIVTIEFPARDPKIFDSLEEPERTQKKTLNGSTLVFDVNFTSDGSAEYTLTITKEGHLPTVVEGFVDFAGDSINVDEFPEELQLPDDPPQASGEDRSGVEVATAASASRIGPDDVQTFLVNNPGLQPAAYSPGDWLEPKDGSNQRMMIVGAGQVSAAKTADPLPAVSPQLDPLLKVQTTVSPYVSPVFAEAVALLGRDMSRPAYSSSNSGITRLSLICMQRDHDIPTRGARYFSRPKSPQDDVQRCQRDCVLEETDEIQLCVWKCEGSQGTN